MNGYLLDSHLLLWTAKPEDVVRLGENARMIIEDADTKLFVSTISVYELTYKHHLGKLPEYAIVVRQLNDVIKTLGATELPVSNAHAEAAGALDWEHRDPFDRILAAQAQVEQLVLITSDAALRDCSLIRTLW
ncbi:MAG: type II toxin-antitoxin system VapC family toxin [Clostridiales Family XIII bacterium]|jgi:PIN domain nuclease of toxin-antitoxin system|nr:type II toxin-antitoxin system VapC family toxin [Clostridiales Family XIII bacterium]